MPRKKGSVKLTRAKIDQICKHIANGNFFEQSLALSAVPRGTGYQWLHLGKTDAETYPLCAEFVAAKIEAEAQFEAKHLANINIKSRDDWKASAWALERKWPERYGRNRLEIVGDKGGAVKVEETAKVILYLPDNGRDTKSENDSDNEEN